MAEVLNENFSSNDVVQCKSMQIEEFEVLESIYPEYISSRSVDGTLKLEVPVELVPHRTVIISEPKSHSTSDSLPTLPEKKTTTQSISLSALPPLLLQIVLPPSYPLHAPPQIISIRATHLWLSEVETLQKTLMEGWETGEPVLYNWIEYLRTGEFLQTMNLLPFTDGNIIALPHPAPQIIAPLLLAHHVSSQSNKFTQNSYPCAICLTTLKGSKCLQLFCKHIFCRSCLEDFWKMCIAEGDVSRVTCPDPECVKKGGEASEEEVARVVTKAELHRWRWLKEKRNIDRDPTVVHCPVEVCQAPVSKPSDVDTESGWSRLRQCPRCDFTFCAFCRRTWHGPLDKCPIAQYEYLALEYLEAEEGSDARARLERRYGKINIRRLVATYEEEKANLEWLKSSTMMCPGCQCYVEKTLGCNHMTCWKCLQHFCYRCGQRLNPDQPYAHFSNPNLPCFNHLFDVLDVDEDDWEVDDGI